MVGSQSSLFGSRPFACLSEELATKEKMATMQRLGACQVKTGFQAEAKAYASAESAKSCTCFKRMKPLSSGRAAGGQIRPGREGPWVHAEGQESVNL